jgi:hypothetical protein
MAGERWIELGNWSGWQLDADQTLAELHTSALTPKPFRESL